MTEGNDDGSNLVRVRAQVMMRDDSTGGWVPMGGGGLSNVSVRKRILQTDHDRVKREYCIYGKRISDQTVVLSCTIKKDFQYNIVMPTFHHWITGDHKFGLTFQTAADARAFDQGVRLAVDDILEGLHEMSSHHHYGGYRRTDVGDDEVFMAVNLPVERDGSRSSSGSVTTCSSGSRHTPTTTPLPTPDHPPHHHHTTTTTTASTPLTTPDLPLHHFHHHHHLHHHHLPHGGGGSTPSVALSTTSPSPASTLSNPATITSSIGPNQHSNHHHHLHRMTYLPRPKPALPPGADKGLSSGEGDKGEPDKIQVLGDAYSYVQFAKTQPHHDYSYPLVEGFKGERRDSIASLKKHHQQQLEIVGGTPGAPSPVGLAPSLLSGKRSSARKRDRRSIPGRRAVKARCRHCQYAFADDANPRGGCEFAPDCVRSAIDKLTCISCAQCMLYHCMSDAEGEFPHHPCECGGPSGESCGRRWLGLTLLSLLVPCLWCYLPLRACHRCGVNCGLCGGKHEAS